MENNSLSRRQFLQSTTTLAAAATATTLAPSILSAKNPNETIGVAHIGIGTRGGDLMRGVVGLPGVKVVAVCDVYKQHLQRGIDRSGNPEVKTYHDYHELLADKNVDAVVIATPDHWHRQIVLDAIAAKKDVYCEKAWGRTLDDVKAMLPAVKNSGIVFQLGHQARQATCALQAKELLASGALGPVHLVRTGRFMNSEVEHPMWRWYGYYSQWERPDPVQVKSEVDWERWLGSAPKREWNERRFWHWRCYWDYGTGPFGDLLTHELDFVQYLLGYGIPESCQCSGRINLLNDDREVPDTLGAVYQFEKHNCTVEFTCSLNSRFKQPVTIHTKEATLQFDGIAHDVTSFHIAKESFSKLNVPQGFVKGKTPQQPSHMEDFINCIRSRKKTKCNEDEAFVETAVALMGITSMREKREVRWDPVKQEII